MIIETTELATAYKGLSSVIIEARSYVETLNHLPEDKESVRKYVKESIAECEKFSKMIQSLNELLKTKAEGYKASVSETIKLNPQKYEEIQNSVEKTLHQYPYPESFNETVKVTLALETKVNILEQYSCENNMAVHHPYQHITEEPFISHPHNTNDQSIEHQYLTTDGIDIENQLTPHIYREREELQQYVQTNKQSKRKIDKHSTPKIHQQIQDGEEAIKQSDWNTNDLIQLVAALIRNGQDNGSNKIKYPEIKIPFYNGDREKFDEFWAIFHQMIHINDNFSTIEKFVYLSSHLTDRAANSIKGIKIISENYDLAINIIIKRFGNKESNQTNIVQLIKLVEPAKNSPQSCRDVFEQIYSHIHRLKSVGCDIISECDPLWKEIIFEKFPIYIQEKLFLQMHTQTEIQWSIEKMLERIDDLIVIAELFEKRGSNISNILDEQHPSTTSDTQTK